MIATLTTIQSPTPAALRLAECTRDRAAGALVVAGDRKGPASYDLPNTTFLSLQTQVEGPFELGRQLPTGHYCRKNIAYLEAIRQGADCIYETDDDNAPLASWAPREEWVRGVRRVAQAADGGRYVRRCVGGPCVCGDGGTTGPQDHRATKSRECVGTSVDRVSGLRTPNSGLPDARPHRWVNVYRYFSDELIWPRGLPLDEIRAPLPAAEEAGGQRSEDGGQSQESGQEVRGERLGVGRQEAGSPESGSTDAQPTDAQTHSPERRAPIQQGLVNGSPDVDAVWRLTMDRPFAFDDRPSVYLEPGNWCPFNTQSTWWWPVAYPLLYIPSHCSFRMCDIWKSFVAQRCLWELGLGVVFHAPEVFQERNPHNLMRDFTDEIPGYQRNQELVRVLAETSLSPGEDAVGANLLRCYEALVAAEFFPAAELALVKTWLSDLEALA